MESSILTDCAYYHNILTAEMESLMGPGRAICMGPYGLKMTKAGVKDLNPFRLVSSQCYNWLASMP